MCDSVWQLLEGLPCVHGALRSIWTSFSSPLVVIETDSQWFNLLDTKQLDIVKVGYKSISDDRYA